MALIRTTNIIKCGRPSWVKYLKTVATVIWLSFTKMDTVHQTSIIPFPNSRFKLFSSQICPLLPS